MEIGAAPAPARRKALGQHADEPLEFSSGEGAVRVGAHNEIIELIFIPVFVGDHGYDLLRQDIKRPRRHVSLIEIAAPDGFEQRRALHQIVAAQWKQPPFGSAESAWPERPTRWSSPAIDRGLLSWHTRSTSPTSIPSSSEAVATSARSAPALSRCSAPSLCSRAMLP